MRRKTRMTNDLISRQAAESQRMNIAKVIIAGMMLYVLRTLIICAAITEILDKNKWR